ncbi:MAG: RluA family pseudouridine synthase [Clostridiales bacterium]|nr:RluA family pseudouridine synthase [Candidatus Cacconaster stercorequi]
MDQPVILYEDPHIVICLKPVGYLSEDSGTARCMPAMLREHYRAAGKNSYIATVHRLDKVVGGVMVFSRRKEVTGKLTAAVQAHQITKEYLAILRGHPAQPSAELTDLLFRDAAHNKSFVVKRMRKGVREARLSYREVGRTDALSLVRIRLHTGRTHQIRVQFSSRSLPLLGDIRYGSKDPNCSAALWSYRLAFTHPITGKPVDVCHLPPDGYPWSLFADSLSHLENT